MTFPELDKQLSVMITHLVENSEGCPSKLMVDACVTSIEDLVINNLSTLTEQYVRQRKEEENRALGQLPLLGEF